MIDVSGRFDAGLIGVLWQVESVGWLRVPYATGTIYGVATGLRGSETEFTLFVLQLPYFSPKTRKRGGKPTGDSP